jgi:DNA mismatch repair protein MutL
MNKIQILENDLIRKIAAGEVIERPASAVKELLENALDAGATQVDVTILEGGKKRIQVADNGSGMTPDDLPLALLRHATSKLKTEEDLWDLTTLGFRGEALPSIAAISRLTLKSRGKGADSGYLLSAAGGEISGLEETGIPEGTQVTVEDLFFNTPARKKFLKSPRTEGEAIVETLIRIALAYPACGFRLNTDGDKTRLDLFSSRDPKERILEILGPEWGDKLIPFEWVRGTFRAWGYLSGPEHFRHHLRDLYTYVNRRWVQERIIRQAVLKGYEPFLIKGRYPVVVLYLEVPRGEVDVNVHPTKLEIRFKDPSAIFALVSEGIKKTLNALYGLPEPVKEGPPALVQGNWEIKERILSFQPLDLFPPRGKFSEMKWIGQFRESYLLLEIGQDLIMVDQHAAHERIQMERLKASFRQGKMLRQKLLFPLSVETGPRFAAHFLECLGDLELLGIEASYLGGTTFAFHSRPSLLPDLDLGAFLAQLEAEWFEGEPLPEKGIKRMEFLMARLACHGAVKAGQNLKEKEVQALMADLDCLEYPDHCPHGRPTWIRLEEKELKKRFGRVR